MDINAEVSLAFAMAENPGVFALLLGSGISRAAQIPTGWEITLDLVRKIAKAQGVADQADWSRWYFDTTGSQPEYSNLLGRLAASTQERRAILHGYIEPTEADKQAGRKAPTKAHQAIARLVAQKVVRVIVTTNFDRLLENALRDEGVEPIVIKTDDDIKGAVPMIHSRCYIVKINGDYLDTRIRNTGGELSRYPPALRKLLDRIFDEHGVLICGWSGDWDIALRDAISGAPNRRYSTYWASRGAPTKAAEDLIAQRAASILKIADADSFFVSLETQISTLVDLRKADPRSAELTVSNVKRLLRQEDGRVELEGILKSELDHLKTVTKSADFRQVPNVDPAEFVRRVGRYESATETLARVFGVLGYWGAQEDNLVNRMIQSAATPEVESGNALIVFMRSYPAMLLMYAFCLGRLASGRFDSIHEILSAKIKDPFSDLKLELVRMLFLDAWRGGERQHWNLLPEFGGQGKFAPLSLHLHRLFQVWSRDYMVIDTEFDQVFDEFELLGALSYLSAKVDKATLQRATENMDARIAGWTPIGRQAFGHARRVAILDRWGREPWRVVLYEHGFVPDVEYLQLAIPYIERLAQLTMAGG